MYGVFGPVHFQAQNFAGTSIQSKVEKKAMKFCAGDMIADIRKQTDLVRCRNVVDHFC